MATIVDNKKNFKIIKLSKEEANELGWGYDDEFLCMQCNEDICKDMYYVAVLNDVLCEDCFKIWLETARNYPEDRAIENKNFLLYARMLGIK